MEGESRYVHVRDLGSGSFGVAQLMRDVMTGELLAVKKLERGSAINEYVEREILNHRILTHPHIVQFREAFLTPQHLAITMEYASGGELFNYLVHERRFSENKARYFFQQLVAGLEYCHSQGVCHRDLKLENVLLAGDHAPLVKICDFGYSKHSTFDSGPKSIVGTKAYIAPEVILSKYQQRKYDGAAADVWSCGVILYLMLVGQYPFEDPADPTNFSATIQRIMAADYEVPADVAASPECRDVLAGMLVGPPHRRITIDGIKAHPFFRKNLPLELQALMQDRGAAFAGGAPQQPQQSLQDLLLVLAQARTKPDGLQGWCSPRRAPSRMGCRADCGGWTAV